MSRIYFHVRNGEDVEVYGQEAHLIHYLAKQIGVGILYNELTSGVNTTPVNSWIKISWRTRDKQECF